MEENQSTISCTTLIDQLPPRWAPLALPYAESITKYVSKQYKIQTKNRKCMNEIQYTNINYKIQKFSTKYTNKVQKITTQYTTYMIQLIQNKSKTRLTYNCAHLRSTKESLTI